MNHRTLLAFCGLALVFLFFFPWLGVGQGLSGYAIASSGVSFWLQLAAASVPLAGVAFLVGAIGGRRGAYAVGAALLGYTALYTAWQTFALLLQLTAPALWLSILVVLVAIVVAIVCWLKR